MPPQTYWNIRRNARREAQIAALGDLTGLGEEFASVIDFAVSYTIAQLKGDRMMDTDEILDRVGAANLDELESEYGLGRSLADIEAGLNLTNWPREENHELAAAIYSLLNK